MKVIIADDQMIIRQGLSMILGKNEEIEVVGMAENGQEAIEICEKIAVDVVLLDINMPIMNGVEATKIIKERWPKVKILVLTTFNDDEYIFGSLKNGASGYLLKDASPDEIINGLMTVYNGETLMNGSVAMKVIDQLKSGPEVLPNGTHSTTGVLTKRERDICHYLGKGCNNKEIGEVLFISEGTVKNNITRILDKLELRDRTQLALFSVKNNL